MQNTYVYRYTSVRGYGVSDLIDKEKKNYSNEQIKYNVKFHTPETEKLRVFIILNYYHTIIIIEFYKVVDIIFIKIHY